jgi:hypothetical protein
MTAKSSACRIATVERQLAAVAQAQVRMSEMPETERSLRAKIDAAVASLDVAPLGRSFTLWRPLGDGRIDYQPGVIVSRPFEPIGEVVPSALPTGRAAHFLLTGPFDGLPGAWHTLSSPGAPRTI